MSVDSMFSFFKNPPIANPDPSVEDLLKEHEVFFAGAIRQIQMAEKEKIPKEKAFNIPQSVLLSILLGTIFYGAGNACGCVIRALLVKSVSTEQTRSLIVRISSVVCGIFGLSLCIFCFLGQNKSKKTNEERNVFNEVIEGVFSRRDQVKQMISDTNGKLAAARSFQEGSQINKETRELQTILDNLQNIERQLLKVPK
jgi:hypothetical protein